MNQTTSQDLVNVSAALATATGRPRQKQSNHVRQFHWADC